jgi:deoxyribonuclease IV
MPTQGGLHNAFHAGREYGCEVIQLFTSSPQQWKARELPDEVVGQFCEAGTATGIPCIAAHANYLINPATFDPEVLEKSRAALLQEVERCARLRIPGVVIHLGCAVGAPETEALDRLVESLRFVLDASDLDGPRLLLETTAGQGTALGYTFEQIARVLDGLDGTERVAVCLDTCHVFAAGYGLSTPDEYAETMSRFETLIGLDRLALIHANDSRRERGSRVDRHHHIGQGHLGEDAFRNLLTDPRLASVPVILETPKADDMDRVNLAALRRLAGVGP